MKKILTLSPSKILLFCGIGLVMTLATFWHHQTNQNQLDKLAVLNQGVSTCFIRISQTFTAMMIKDIRSPYLDRGFMSLSNECVSETVKGANPFKKNIGKGYATLNQLISEVHWFHEKVSKVHEPMLKDQNLNVPLTPLSNRFSKMEGFKVALVDEIDSVSNKIREVQINDEFLMGAGLIIFVLAISLLSLQEFNRIQVHREIERNAIDLLKSGNANVGAIVDQLVDRALTTQGMPVTAQIFKDYHEDLLVKSPESKQQVEKPAALEAEVVGEEVAVVEAISELKAPDTAPVVLNTKRASLKEAIASIQKIHSKEFLMVSDVRDVQLAVEFESFEQIMNSAVSQLMGRRQENKKIIISNQIHSDKSIINISLSDSTFSAGELEFYSSDGAQNDTSAIDMNMIILKEMASEAGVSLHLENKSDKQGRISGMNIRFIVGRTPKESKMKNLVSVVKGKKKDLTRNMMS